MQLDQSKAGKFFALLETGKNNSKQGCAFLNLSIKTKCQGVPVYSSLNAYNLESTNRNLGLK